MNRVIKIEKVHNITLVTVTENGNQIQSYSSIRRVVSKHLNGVKIEPNPEEPEFNNFYIPLDELKETFGAKTPSELYTQFAARGFFSGASSAVPGEPNNVNQNNKVKEINLPFIIYPPLTSPLDAVAAQLNEYSDLEVLEDEILLVNVGRLIPGSTGPGES